MVAPLSTSLLTCGQASLQWRKFIPLSKKVDDVYSAVFFPIVITLHLHLITATLVLPELLLRTYPRVWLWNGPLMK